jgi:homoserine acetyltransferase
VVFAPAASDQAFPTDAAERAAMQQAWGARFLWRELHTPFGHLASGMELAQWEPALQPLLAGRLA